MSLSSLPSCQGGSLVPAARVGPRILDAGGLLGPISRRAHEASWEGLVLKEESVKAGLRVALGTSGEP